MARILLIIKKKIQSRQKKKCFAHESSYMDSMDEQWQSWIQMQEAVAAWTK